MKKNNISTVGVAVLKRNKVLLVKHGEKAGHITGIYGLPGGRINSVETTKQAAVRELREETGIVAREEDLHQLPKTYAADILRKNNEVLSVFHTVFVCTKFAGTLLATEETKPEWVSAGDLQNLYLLINTEDMITQAKKMV